MGRRSWEVEGFFEGEIETGFGCQQSSGHSGDLVNRAHHPWRPNTRTSVKYPRLQIRRAGQCYISASHTFRFLLDEGDP